MDRVADALSLASIIASELTIGAATEQQLAADTYEKTSSWDYVIAGASRC